MTTTITTTELKKEIHKIIYRFSIDELEDLIITRCGKPVAIISSYNENNEN